MKRGLAFVLASSVAALCVAVEEPTPRGGWLAERGVAFSACYFAEAFANVSGGRSRGTVFDGLLYLSLELDLERIAAWRGAKLHVDAFDSHGASLTAKHVGDLGVVSSIDFYDTYRLSELWLEQRFFEDRFSLRVGQLALDAEFMTSRSAATFINASFAQSNALVFNVPSSVYGLTALGARMLIAPTRHFYFQAAAYDGNPAPGIYRDFSPDAAASNEFNRHSTHWALRDDEGALLIAEAGVRFNQPQEKELTTLRGLAGSYKAGVFYHTDTFADIHDGMLTLLGSSHAPAAVRAREGNYGFYFVADQELWREPGRETDGLGFFARAAFAPHDRNPVDFSAEAGLVYEGLLQPKGKDALGIAFAWINVSRSVRKAVRLANHVDAVGMIEPDYEAIIELTYRFELAPWWTIQPNVQWILHPGGSSAIDNALVIGLRTTVGF